MNKTAFLVLVALLLVILVAPPGAAAPTRLGKCQPAEVGLHAEHLQWIDRLVEEALEEGEMAGCVVAIGRHGKLAYLQAYGHRQIESEKQPMTTDTLFDMASITKPVATATSIMLLIQRGQLRLEDSVADYLPEFAAHGKDEITVLHLLTHQGGLIPDNPLKDYQDGAEQAWQRIDALELQQEPGTKFVYTDVGFLVLGQLVEKLTGQNVAEFSQQNIFEPLGMCETGYLPGEALRQRAAATEQRDEQWIVGQVHDPRAYALDGIAGHAGLFSTAEDLAVYAQMMLDQGSYQGVHILSPATVDLMTRAYSVSRGTRGLGWDKQSPYSSNRSELYSESAFGHGGFTGTVLWIDPKLDLFVIFLSNRLHPDGKGLVNPLAGRIGSVAAGAINENGPAAKLARSPDPQASPLHPVLTGIDVLQRDGFEALKGQRVGLITNHTGVDRSGRSTVEILHQAEEVDLVALFSPEHGFQGKLDQANIDDTHDAATGLPVYSLYGESRKPTAESLQDLDTLVFDIQDIGARFYTYISTMGHAMQAAAEHGKRVVVLDRPNPINGVDVAGPVLDEGLQSFVGFHQLPIRHGMTVGELATMFRKELDLDLELHVVPLEGWQRADHYDATGLLWIDPSPNMRSLTQALLYPGVGLLETTNVSVGRGTDTPFELIGAPWIDPQQLADALNRAQLPGVSFVPRYFTPDSSTHAGERCGGINVLITDRSRFEPIGMGLEIATQLRRLYTDQWEAGRYKRLLGDERLLKQLLAGESPAEMQAAYQQELEEFKQRRERYLLYGEGIGD